MYHRIGAGKPKKNVGVVFSIVLGVAIFVIGGVRIFIARLDYERRMTSLVAGTLEQARAGHPTRLLKSGPSPQEYDNNVPENVQLVRYASGSSPMIAWMMRPNTAGRHPAVLFAHGGFALGGGDEEGPQAFVDAGYVVMLPAWRGENGNAGSFEMFFGEVNDARAALDYLAAQPDVDPKRLYAAGHSVGGTLVMLLAEIDPRLRKVAACGGCPNMREIAEKQKECPFADECPYDWKDKLESDLRSPLQHLADLKCPLALFYGENDRNDRYLYRQAVNMQRIAEGMGKSITITPIPDADHQTALEPAITRMVAWFGQ